MQFLVSDSMRRSHGLLWLCGILVDSVQLYDMLSYTNRVSVCGDRAYLDASPILEDVRPARLLRFRQVSGDKGRGLDAPLIVRRRRSFLSGSNSSILKWMNFPKNLNAILWCDLFDAWRPST